MQYTQAQIDRANAVSLEDFLRTQGETLIKSGREYRWKEHDSHSCSLRHPKPKTPIPFPGPPAYRSGGTGCLPTAHHRTSQCSPQRSLLRSCPAHRPQHPDIGGRKLCRHGCAEIFHSSLCGTVCCPPRIGVQRCEGRSVQNHAAPLRLHVRIGSLCPPRPFGLSS